MNHSLCSLCPAPLPPRMGQMRLGVAMATPPALQYSPAQFLPWGTSRRFHLAGCCFPGREREEAGKGRETEADRQTSSGTNKWKLRCGEGTENLTEKQATRGRQTDNHDAEEVPRCCLSPWRQFLNYPNLPGAARSLTQARPRACTCSPR